MHKRIFFITSCFLFLKGFGQLPLSLRDCEERFLQTNFTLLAEKYNIEATYAEAVQASLWENPYFSMEGNALNPQYHKAFSLQKDGQKAATLQQLIYLGGKKKKEVQVANAAADVAELSFQELLQGLRYQLRTTYFSLYYDEQVSNVLDQQLQHLDSLLQVYKQQVEKGNIPLKDLVRLQSMYLNLYNDRSLLRKAMIEAQKTLKILVASDSVIMVQPLAEELAHYNRILLQSESDLLVLAQSHQAGWLLAQKNKEAAERQLQWQRSLAIPDLTVGLAYDQNGGAFHNQVNLVLGMPLPIWNRNGGRIRAASARVQEADYRKQSEAIRLKADIHAAYAAYLLARADEQKIEQVLTSNADLVYQGVYENFSKRNITLMEFTDFLESYHNSQIQLRNVRKSLTQACEQLNYVTGSNLF